MGQAQRQDDARISSAADAGCAQSPYCRLPAKLAGRFGGLDGIWMHHGPIGEEYTALTFHRAERPRRDQNAGVLMLETRPAWKDFAGCHLDSLCFEHNPGGGAVRHVEPLGGSRTVLWRVFATAWCDDGETRVTWTAPGLGLRDDGYVQFCGPGRPSAATHQQLARLAHLLDGGRTRRGRPSRWADPSWLAHADDVLRRARARKAEQPQLPWNAIADAMGMSDRQLREIRRVLEAECADGPRLLQGGD